MMNGQAERRKPAGGPAGVPAGRAFSVLDAQGRWLVAYYDLDRAHEKAHQWAEWNRDVTFMIDPVGGYSWRVTPTSCFRARWGAAIPEQRCRWVPIEGRYGAAG